MGAASSSNMSAVAPALGDSWRVLLRQHCVISDPAVYCKLLCCSRAISTSLAEHSGGQLQLHFTASRSTYEAGWDNHHAASQRRIQQLGVWLAKHASLLAELHVLPWRAECIGPLMREAVEVADAALHQAAERAKCEESDRGQPQGDVLAAAAGVVTATAEAAAPVPSDYCLPLRSLRYVSWGYSDGAVLQHLSPNSLTELELRLSGMPAGRANSGGYCEQRSSLEAVDKPLSNLHCLIQLQRLTLGVEPNWAVRSKQQQLYISGRTMQVLAGLSQLKQLSLHVAVASTVDLWQLPASLQQLSLCCYEDLLRDELQPALQLRQLSQLVSFQLSILSSGSLGEQLFSLQAGDQLPLQVQQVGLGCSIEQIDPILQLQQLRELGVYRCTLDAMAALRLTALENLSALTLIYGWADADLDSDATLWTPGGSSCCIWQQLPLTDLTTNVPAAGPKIVPALGLATRLTSLHIGECTVQATGQQLALQLSKLQSLRQLYLDVILRRPPQPDGVPGSNLPALSGQDDADVSSGSEGDGGYQQALQTLSWQTSEAAAEAGRAVLAVIARLPLLNTLTLYGDTWSTAAVLELQVATQLTRLTIASHGSENSMDDEAAVCLCSSLTGLRNLSITSPVLTATCLPAVRRLQHLEQASLNDNEDYNFECQMFKVDGVLLAGVLRTGSGHG